MSILKYLSFIFIISQRGKGCQGTCIKDTWTKPKEGRIEGRRRGWLGWRKNGDNCT